MICGLGRAKLVLIHWLCSLPTSGGGLLVIPNEERDSGFEVLLQSNFLWLLYCLVEGTGVICALKDLFG